jgi:hypothetical protein
LQEACSRRGHSLSRVKAIKKIVSILQEKGGLGRPTFGQDPVGRLRNKPRDPSKPPLPLAMITLLGERDGMIMELERFHKTWPEFKLLPARKQILQK